MAQPHALLHVTLDVTVYIEEMVSQLLTHDLALVTLTSRQFPASDLRLGISISVQVDDPVESYFYARRRFWGAILLPSPATDASSINVVVAEPYGRPILNPYSFYALRGPLTIPPYSFPPTLTVNIDQLLELNPAVDHCSDPHDVASASGTGRVVSREFSQPRGYWLIMVQHRGYDHTDRVHRDFQFEYFASAPMIQHVGLELFTPGHILTLLSAISSYSPVNARFSMRLLHASAAILQ
ncbi:uncharacterized protein MELLADRAFT_63217 [Melampsora larici-populina 98AG31]|uniref:Uncharacterized protein n=1 Tax=Melampsora larici-populina (strain 98AG31 / pathotype 3-4-7) TaxID=747676 RepID=F4RLV1_MELLP|nr:uncharacterized protein MELLADRAFT_63217 [Melampsora larici-populina 98AG31]EGG06605.1 hypothetical protein MELLADRAFT_63217 [Melampsora larici-populina 98AG31]